MLSFVGKEHLKSPKVIVHVVFEIFWKIHVVERVEDANKHPYGGEKYLKSGRIGSLGLHLLAGELQK